MDGSSAAPGGEPAPEVADVGDGGGEDPPLVLLLHGGEQGEELVVVVGERGGRGGGRVHRGNPALQRPRLLAHPLLGGGEGGMEGEGQSNRPGFFSLDLESKLFCFIFL